MGTVPFCAARIRDGSGVCCSERNRPHPATYDGTTIHAVYQGSGDNTNAAIVATYSTDLAGALLSTKAQASGNLTYPITDNTGSITSQTNTTGQTVATTQYGAFGDPHATSGTDTGAGNAYTFTGHAYDTGTDLVYARARYYDPTVGTFLSEDPLGSINNYTYALNQPTNLVDPTGAEVAMEYGELSDGETGVAADAEALAADDGLAFFSRLAARFRSIDWSDETGAVGRGTPRTNIAQNKQFSDAIKEAQRRLGRTLSKDEWSAVHREISGQGYGYHDIVDEILSMFGGG